MNSKEYIAAIDGMRGIAVLSVLGFHFFPNHLPGGFIGVDIFFVISGYLISNIIIREVDNGTFTFKEFFFRRIRRIFPALIVVFFFVLTLGWFSLFPDEYYNIGKHVLSSNFFILNYILLNEGGYFDVAANLKPLLHLWSLSIEEQFYIIWPIIIYYFYKKKIFVKILIFFLIISFFTNIYLTENSELGSFYSSIARFWEILFGFSLGYFLKSHNLKYSFLQKNSNKLLLFLLSVITVSFFSFNKLMNFPGWWAIIPVMATSLVLILVKKGSFVQKKILSNKILVWFGLISYPLYLWHFPILSYYTIIYGHLPDLINKVTLIIFSIFLSWITYYYLEKPIRFGDKKTIKVYFLFLCSLVVIFFSSRILLKEGYDQRLTIEPKQARVLYLPYPHAPMKNLACKKKFKQLTNYDSCLLSNFAKNPEILILGDSHGQQYYKAFAKSFPKKSILNISKWSCFPFVSDYHLYKNNCKNSSNQIINFIEKQDSIKTIIITGYFNYLSSNGFVMNNNIRKPSKFDKKTYETFEKNGTIFINKIISMNKKILIIKDIPNLNFHPKDCVVFENLNLRKLHFNYNKKNMKNCFINFEEYKKENVLYNKYFNKFILKFKSINIFDPKDIVCDSKKCFAFINNEAMFYNPDHLTMLGSLKITNKIKEKYFK